MAPVAPRRRLTWPTAPRFGLHPSRSPEQDSRRAPPSTPARSPSRSGPTWSSRRRQHCRHLRSSARQSRGSLTGVPCRDLLRIQLLRVVLRGELDNSGNAAHALTHMRLTSKDAAVLALLKRATPKQRAEILKKLGPDGRKVARAVLGQPSSNPQVSRAVRALATWQASR